MKNSRQLPRGVWVNKGEYWIRYRDRSGQLHREAVGPLLTQAIAAYQKRRTEIREGKFFPESVTARPVLFGEVAQQYLQLAKGRKRSWDKDQDHLENLLPALKDAPVASLTPGRLESVLAGLADQRQWAPATFNRHRATLSAVFKQAMKDEKCRSNPAKLVAHRKENNERVRYLSAEEEARLIAVLRCRWPKREAEIVTAIHTGMRRSEQYRTAQVPDGGLKWEHIDFRAGVIRLPRSKPDKPREIRMNSVVRDTLRAIPQRINSPYVFRQTDPQKWFRRVLRAAGIKNFRWHDLRHTFGSRLAMKGVPIRDIALLMGHSQIQVTMRYCHLQPGNLADAVERLVEPQPVPEKTQVSPEVSPAVSGLPRK